ncbi:hypothetical protein TNCV_3282091 [Trichonephila clavipes]|nr:hypothetical protein TNCV_3282091 [Trichonephila clavipes]
MASKRKHSTLTLQDKLEVLKRLVKGEGVTKLATEFNVGKASVGDFCEWMEEDGETAEFLTDDDIAAAVTQEPMEEEGSDDEIRSALKIPTIRQTIRKLALIFFSNIDGHENPSIQEISHYPTYPFIRRPRNILVDPDFN